MATTKRTRRSAYAPNARTRVARARNREWILAKVPDELRQQVDRWANDWLRTKFGRLLELRAADPGPFNYPIEVFSEWRGKAFYLCVRYRTGQGTAAGRLHRPQCASDDDWVRSIRPRVLSSHRALVHGLSRLDGDGVLPRDRGERGLLAGDVRRPADVNSPLSCRPARGASTTNFSRTQCISVSS